MNFDALLVLFLKHWFQYTAFELERKMKAAMTGSNTLLSEL